MKAETNNTQEKTKTPRQNKRDEWHGNEARWCPGCGDHAILNSVLQVCSGLGIPRENFAFVSGIGCSSRMPYYVGTYGFHTIHGRALPVATGVRLANPELQVWVPTGDGDALSIGGNHFLHTLRRNTNLKIMLFNNRIYGLTKGQCSPTSEAGKVTKSTPWGSLDQPVLPVSLALAAEATFVARTAAVYLQHMREIFTRAAEHKGAAFIEILQNCVVFNNGAFKSLTDRAVRDDRQIVLKHGEPLIFGKAKDRGIRIRNFRAEVVRLGKDGVTKKDLHVHDEHDPQPAVADLLARMNAPVSIGIFRDVEKDTIEELAYRQIDTAVKKKGAGDLATLFHDGDTWEVKPQPQP